MVQKRAVQWGLIAIAAVAVFATSSIFDEGPTTQHATSSAPTTDALLADLPFDFYILALSWSPAFCASPAGQNARQQCGQDADYRFITHGLWPQFEDGWPSYCQSDFPDRMPPAHVERLLDVMPDRGLIEHQWDKHGTCTGLSPRRYTDLILEASEQTTIPEPFLTSPSARMSAADIEQAFLEVNADMTADGIAVTCPNGRFAEVRICLNKDLSPRSCQQVNRQGCAQGAITIEAPN